MVSTSQKRGFLRDCKRQANGKSLAVVLQEILASPAVTLQKGRMLVSVGSGEVNTSYSISVGVNQAQVLELVAELLDLYDDAQAVLIEAGTSAPTDEQIYAQMMVDLRPIKGFIDNFNYLSK